MLMRRQKFEIKTRPEICKNVLVRDCTPGTKYKYIDEIFVL